MTKQQDLWWDCPAPLDSNLHKVQVFWATHQYQEARRIVDEDQAGEKTIPEACVDDVKALVNEDFYLSYTEDKGRCLIAGRDFDVAEVIFSERPILRGMTRGDASRRVFMEE